jgi:hypothetical protein
MSPSSAELALSKSPVLLLPITTFRMWQNEMSGNSIADEPEYRNDYKIEVEWKQVAPQLKK